MSETWTIGRLIPWAAQYLAGRQVSAPRLSAELMLAEVLACGRVDLYLRFEQPLTPEELAAFKALLLRRRSGEPLAYILGRREFYGLDLAVTPAVLIPRPETEHLVEEGLRLLSQRPPSDPPPRILDLCTGSGAVALALAHELPEASVTATDLSPPALEVARANAERLGLAARLTLLAGNLWEPLAAAQGFFDLITANPPYVTEAEWADLSPEVKDFEPRSALVPGPQGLELARQIIIGARAHLRPLGWLLLEMGASQANEAKAVARAANVYDDIHTVADLAGIDRVLACRRKDGG
jgi:release factor glutamine methyltransferase